MVTYKQAGVDIDAGNLFAQMVKERVAKAWPDAAKEIGGFAGKIFIPGKPDEISGSTDGTGTKAIIAALTDNYDGIGQGAVAMGAVDTFVAGFRPWALLDSLDVAKLVPEKHIRIIDSVIRGCKLAGCRLIGGETAELPDMFKHDWMFNINVFVIGLPNSAITFNKVKAGQSIIGWPSNGPALNGFSLIRKVFQLKERPSRARKRLQRVWPELEGKTLAEVLLEPTPIWIPEIDNMFMDGVKFSGHAHITGGGMVDNIPRILPKNLKVVIDRGCIRRPPIFKLIEEFGKVSRKVMDRTFNNGVMLVSIVSNEGESIDFDYGKFILIGKVERRKTGEPQVVFTGKYPE